jgi:hypothetical protein
MHVIIIDSKVEMAHHRMACAFIRGDALLVLLLVRWIGGLERLPICASSQVVSKSVLSFACPTNPEAARAVYIAPQTTPATTCRRHNQPSRAEQDHLDSRTPPVQTVRCATNTSHFDYPCLKPPAHNHYQSHLRQPATLYTGETFLDSASFATPSAQRLSHPSRLLNRGAYFSPAPLSSSSGTATCRLVHTDGADKT